MADLTLTLSNDQGLVLFDLLWRVLEDDSAIVFEDQAEERVLADMLATLEAGLLEPLESNYAQLLAAARSKVRAKV